MRRMILGLCSLALAACSDSTGDDVTQPGDTSGTPGTSSTSSTSSGTPSDTSTETPTATQTPTDPHPLGMDFPPFALLDLNPASDTFGETVDGAELLGKPYAMIFLDSRCAACPDVADDIWATYEAHSTWWEAQPTFAVERLAALEMVPDGYEKVVEGNSLPYLADTEDSHLWNTLLALNHDFFAISAEGKLDAWLKLYNWPDDLELFVDHMTERYEP